MATANFLAKYRANLGTLYILARIAIPRVDGTQFDTIYAAMADVLTPPDSVTTEVGHLWVNCVQSFGKVHHPGAFASTDLSLCTGSMVLNPDFRVTLPEDVGGEIVETIRETLITHQWVNARVTLFRWLDSLSDFHDAQAILSDAGILDWSLNSEGLSLSLRQTIPWNRPLTPRPVTLQEFPRAPDSAVGLGLPIVYGDMTSLPMRAPWAPYPEGFINYDTIRSGLQKSGRYAKAVLTDTGRGGQAATNPDARVHAAGHAVKTIHDLATGSGLWVDMGAGISRIWDPGAGGGPRPVLFNDASGAGIRLPDGYRAFLTGLVPSDVVALSGSARDPRNLLTPSDTSFATLDLGAGNYRAFVTMPGMPPDASLDGASLLWFIMGYRSTSNLDYLYGMCSHTPGQQPLYGGGQGVIGNNLGEVGVQTTPGFYVSGPHTWAGGSFGFADNGFSDTSQLIFGFTWNMDASYPSPANGIVRIYFMGMMVASPIRKALVQSERIIGTKELEIRPRSNPGITIKTPFLVPLRTPAVTELRADLYSSLKGHADDVVGTYSGAGSAVIERAPDIATHLMNVYGGLALGSIERGVGAFGSFIDARAMLVPSGDPPLHALSISEATDVLTAVIWLCGDSLTLPAVSPYDNKVKLTVWRVNPPVTHPWSLRAEEVHEPLGPDLTTTALPDVVTDIRISYGYDDRQRTYREEVSVAPDSSKAGYEGRNIRDQNLEIVAGKNDRMDFYRGGNFTAALTPGLYTHAGLASHVAAAMRAADSGGYYWCSFGGRIESGKNDRIVGTITSLGSFSATLNAGTYSMEALATEVARALNAEAGGWTCTYSRTTRKFTIARASLTFTIKWLTATGGDKPSHATALLGYATEMGSALIKTSDAPVDEDRFLVVGDGGFDILFMSGTNGGDSATSVRHCGELLGFSPADRLYAWDNVGSALGAAFSAQVAKGSGETVMKLAASIYGRRRELNHQARTIQRDRAALLLRQRMVELFTTPRGVISFTTRMLPDIERGQVIQFREEMLRPYTAPGSDGLWVGKKFVVVEVSHDLGPTSLGTSVTAVDTAEFPIILPAPPPRLAVAGAGIEIIAGAAIDANATIIGPLTAAALLSASATITASAIGAGAIPMGNVIMEV